MPDEIFEGKTFQDLTKDIYNNANQKKQQIEILIKEMNKEEGGKNNGSK